MGILPMSIHGRLARESRAKMTLPLMGARAHATENKGKMPLPGVAGLSIPRRFYLAVR